MCTTFSVGANADEVTTAERFSDAEGADVRTALLVGAVLLLILVFRRVAYPQCRCLPGLNRRN